MRIRRRAAVCLMQSPTPLSLWLMQRVGVQVGARSAQRRRLVPCRLHCRTRIRGPLPIVHASRHLTRIRRSLVWEQGAEEEEGAPPKKTKQRERSGRRRT